MTVSAIHVDLIAKYHSTVISTQQLLCTWNSLLTVYQFRHFFQHIKSLQVHLFQFALSWKKRNQLSLINMEKYLQCGDSSKWSTDFCAFLFWLISSASSSSSVLRWRWLQDNTSFSTVYMIVHIHNLYSYWP